jgi:alpha-tubulin suppressor-like RCC1 family protein
MLAAPDATLAAPATEREPAVAQVLPPKQPKVATSNDMSIAVRSDGSVWTWGYNYKQRLARLSGNSRREEELVPGRVHGLVGIRSVAFRYDVALALDGEGRVWAWGNNGNGQLGYETPGPQTAAPALVPGLRDVVEMVPAAGTNMYLLKDGSAWGVGSNRGGILGASMREERVPLRRIEGLPPLQRIAVDSAIAAGIDEQGRLWTWGATGELSGRADAEPTYERTPGGGYRSSRKIEALFNAPGVVPLPAKAVDVVVSGAMVVLLADGTVWSWGWAREGQLGRSNNAGTVMDPVPARLPALTGVVQVAAAQNSFTALTRDGRLYAWGAEANAPMPPAPLPPTQANEPVLIKKGLRIRELTPGGWGYLDQEGNWWSWGGNRYGTSGTGTRVEPCAAGGDCDKGYFLTPEKAQWNHFAGERAKSP